MNMPEAFKKSSDYIIRAIRRRSWGYAYHLRIDNTQKKITFKFFNGAIDEELEWEANANDIRANDWEVLNNPPGVVGDLRIDQAIEEALQFTNPLRIRRTFWGSSHYLHFSEPRSGPEQNTRIVEHKGLDPDNEIWQPSEEDLTTSDWQTINPKPEL